MIKRGLNVTELDTVIDEYKGLSLRLFSGSGAFFCLNKTENPRISFYRVIYLKIEWKKLIISIFVPLAVGGVSTLLTKNGMESFETIIKPPLSPPAWLFPVVWTALYILMGVACYLVWTTPKKEPNALFYYGIQLFFNFFWSIIYFNIKNYLFAFIWLLLLWAAILITTVKFYRTKKAAGYLMIPYLLWVTFAGYLNLGIYFLNR